MEEWNAYDKDFKLIPDKKLIRGQKIPEGLFHLVVEVVVRHSDGDFLLMKRDPRKALGNMWEATAGGAALYGETPIDGAMRELKEETGIVATKMTQLGEIMLGDAFFVAFLCETDWNKDNIVLQEGETIDFKWVSKEELLAMDKDTLASVRMLNYLKVLNI